MVLPWAKPAETRPPTPAQSLSRRVQDQHVNSDVERIAINTIVACINGLAKFCSECESEAVMNGSHKAEFFRTAGQAIRAYAVGIERLSLLPPKADSRSRKSARFVLDLMDEEDDDFSFESVGATPPKASPRFAI